VRVWPLVATSLRATCQPPSTPRSNASCGCAFQSCRTLSLAWAQDTGADLTKTNVNGGAIAIGHPLGVSGARIMTTLVNALEQRGGRYGLQTMCEGGGMANATIIERLR
jgi:acetyl-CoA acetyltransferase